jgi:hypothetical protein
MAKARKMVALNIEETSGVDHPAHLHEGWLVIKSENLTGVDDLLSDLQANQESDASLLTEETMPQDEKVELAAHTPEDKKKMSEEDKTKGMGMSYGDMEDKIKQLTDKLMTRSIC